MDMLAKAKAIPVSQRSKKPNQQLAQVAVAWASDEITLNQAAGAFSRKGTAMYSLLSSGLRDAVRLGMLVKS